MVDGAESELGILDLIQVFVESLDRTFENVCELDLVFHFDEVHLVLAEIIQGGLVLETNLGEISSCGKYYASSWRHSILTLRNTCISTTNESTSSSFD